MSECGIYSAIRGWIFCLFVLQLVLISSAISDHMLEPHNIKNSTHGYIDELNRLFKQTKITDVNGAEIDFIEGFERAAEIIIKANSRGNKVIFIGNGGSAATASHKALDYWFTGKIRGIAFSDHANLTCVSNDFGYQNVFVKQIEMFADKGDVLAAISSSGNSENIVLAVEAARQRGCAVFTFSGFKETNRLRGLGDLNFYTPVSHYNKVESLHLLLCDAILEIITNHRNNFLTTNEHMKENTTQSSDKNILVAVDRDGTLIYDDNGYFGRQENWRENLRFYNGVVDGLKILNNFADVVVASNQIGVARGFYGADRVKEINECVDYILKGRGVSVDGWYFCPFVERKWAEKEGLNLESEWVLDDFPETRKPNVGMLKLALSDLGKDFNSYKKIFAIGDSLDDVNMALNAGGIGVFLRNEKNNNLISQVRELELVNPDRIFYANNFFHAAEIIKSLSLS